MAKASRTGPKPQNRRGSPEPIEKRRAARLFNDILGGRYGGPRRRRAGVLNADSGRSGRLRKRAA